MSTNLSVANLPDISNARLPAVYEKASQALAECSRIDECQQWADKAAALASYAKQSRDESLLKMAMRIKARAIRRCGELLKQVEPAKNQHDVVDRASGDAPTSRTEAAQQAGMSRDQKITALRVASVPAEDFERQIESEAPPTVTALAEQGKKKLVDLGDSRPQDFALATRALAQLKRFAEFARSTDPARVAAGVRPAEVADAREHVRAIDSWLDQFITRVGD